jgi:hypothetical protein
MNKQKFYNPFCLGLIFSTSVGVAASRSPDADLTRMLEDEFGTSESGFQVESSLSPEDVFTRVPLTPPMSESNWRKWAGPMVEKSYSIQRGDTLWGISDKLFGTPYLWPKIWQLNAVFGNAHQIEPGLQLRFSVGNPNSAPALAVDLARQADFEYANTDVSFTPPTLLQRLEAMLSAQSDGKIPPFRSFLMTDRIKSVGVVPKRPDERFLYDGGETFDTEIKDGTYSIVRWEKFRNISGYRVFWTGVVNVIDGKAYIAKAFTEIRPGDVITPRLFLLSPLAIHEQTVGESKQDDYQLIPVEEGYRVAASEYMTMGIRFKYDNAGPQPGALLNLTRLGQVTGKAMLVDRDRRSGTLWVISTKGEVTGEHSIE